MVGRSAYVYKPHTKSKLCDSSAMMLLLNAGMSRTFQERVGRELMVRSPDRDPSYTVVENCCVLYYDAGGSPASLAQVLDYCNGQLAGDAPIDAMPW